MVHDFDTVAVRGLTKTFGTIRALSGVDADFTAGTIIQRDLMTLALRPDSQKDSRIEWPVDLCL